MPCNLFMQLQKPGWTLEPRVTEKIFRFLIQFYRDRLVVDWLIS
jgi:hypothetical protein